jgi:pSer/pThr/pTyr-binding forkhead associated (FHA) protein
MGPGAAPAPSPSPGGAQSSGRIAGFLLTFDVDPRGSFWPLRVGENRIGRKGAEGPLDVAVDHPTVSSNHAIIHVEGNGAVAQLEDQRSANGTLLHEKAIAGQGRREIRDGDRVRLGAVNVIVKLVELD